MSKRGYDSESELNFFTVGNITYYQSFPLPPIMDIEKAIPPPCVSADEFPRGFTPLTNHLCGILSQSSQDTKFCDVSDTNAQSHSVQDEPQIHGTIFLQDQVCGPLSSNSEVVSLPGCAIQVPDIGGKSYETTPAL